MAKREFIEGIWSHIYEYVEISRDDGSCRKRFKWREEEDLAEAYFNQLQSLDNQLQTLYEQKRAADEQKRAADELKALRNAAEEKERIFRPLFPPPSKQVLDPEYQEWLQFKKETDPEFAKWKRAKKEAEQKRIASEIAYKKKEEEERRKKEEETKQKWIAFDLARKRKKEEELKPHEENILAKKKLPCQLRAKVAKETYREEVMLRCVRDSAISVFKALKQNPNLTPKVRAIIAKKENSPADNSLTYKKTLPPSSTNDGKGCFGGIMIIAIVVGIILYCL